MLANPAGKFIKFAVERRKLGFGMIEMSWLNLHAAADDAAPLVVASRERIERSLSCRR